MGLLAVGMGVGVPDALGAAHLLGRLLTAWGPAIR